MPRPAKTDRGVKHDRLGLRRADARHGEWIGEKPVVAERGLING